MAISTALQGLVLGVVGKHLVIVKFNEDLKSKLGKFLS